MALVRRPIASVSRRLALGSCAELIGVPVAFEPCDQRREPVCDVARICQRDADTARVAGRAPRLASDLALDELAQSGVHRSRPEPGPERRPDLVADLHSGNAVALVCGLLGAPLSAHSPCPRIQAYDASSNATVCRGAERARGERR